VADLIAGAPADHSAVAVIEHALTATAESLFEPRRDEMRRWREIVDSDDALRERGLSKQRSIVAAAVDALVDRGFEAATADLAAGVGFVAFQSAATAWHADVDAARPLTSYVEDAFLRLRAMAISRDGGR